MSDSDSAPEEITFQDSKKQANKRSIEISKIKSEQAAKLRAKRRQTDERLKAQAQSHSAKKLSEILQEQSDESSNEDNESDYESNDLTNQSKSKVQPVKLKPVKPTKKTFKNEDGFNVQLMPEITPENKPRQIPKPQLNNKRDQLLYRKLNQAGN